MKILNSKEEDQLTIEELKEYYSNLKEYLLNSPHQSLTKGSLTICPKINGLVRNALIKGCGYKINTTGSEKIKGLVGIYAHTHQSKYDHVNLVASNPNHTIILNSSVLSNLYKMVLAINGVVYVDKSSKSSKQQAKLEMLRLLHQDKSITIFPESAWNLSPNKLHLPLYVGFVDMAKKTGKPIIPVAHHYNYIDEVRDGVERIESVDVHYGEPIYVSAEDNIFEKLAQYSEVISTMRWQQIEAKGIHHRAKIDNAEYINFVNFCIKNLNDAGIDVNVERDGIYGANDDFYLFHYLNAVDYDENGNFIPTEHVRKLNKLSH